MTNLKTYDYDKPDDCNDFAFGEKNPRRDTDFYATEHILELQTIANFLDYVDEEIRENLPDYRPGAGDTKQYFCDATNQLWTGLRGADQFEMDGVKRNPIDHILAVMPSNDNDHVDEFVLLETGVNAAKKGIWSKGNINADETMKQYMEADPDRAVRNLKDVMSAMKYMQDPTIKERLIKEKKRVAARLKELDEDKMPKLVRHTGDEKWSTWKSQGLEAKWNTFIKERATNAKDKAVKYLDDNIKDLRESYVTSTNKEQAKGPSEAARQLKTIIEKIEKLDAEWKRYKPNSWTNPF